MKITRYICFLVILPVFLLYVTIKLNGTGPYGGPLFSVTYCGVLVPAVKIIENPQLRKFASSCLKDFFNNIFCNTTN